LIPTAPVLPDGFASVPTQSLVPPVLATAASKEEYLERLAEGDSYFDSLREEARKEGKVVRYVGVVDITNGKVEARLGKYPYDHAFATALKGSDNIVSFHTARYSPRPLIVQGAGAGADVTAMGVTSDMLKIYERVTPRRV
jgi:homoserine dehydrogenase